MKEEQHCFEVPYKSSEVDELKSELPPKSQIKDMQVMISLISTTYIINQIL